MTSDEYFALIGELALIAKTPDDSSLHWRIGRALWPWKNAEPMSVASRLAVSLGFEANENMMRLDDSDPAALATLTDAMKFADAAVERAYILALTLNSKASTKQ